MLKPNKNCLRGNFTQTKIENDLCTISYSKLSRLNSTWVINENVQNIVLISSSRTAWSMKTVIPFLSFLVLHGDCMSVKKFEIVHKTCSILVWGVVPPYGKRQVINIVMQLAIHNFIFCQTISKQETDRKGNGKLNQLTSSGALWEINQLTASEALHREIVPPRKTVAIARVAIAVVGRGGWGSLPYTVANENQMKA